MIDFPEGLKYDKKYLWIKIEEDIATIGIIKSAAALAKEFVFIQLPEKGKIKKGGKLISLEAMKWSGEVDSPLSGEIVDVHDSLFDDPAIINKDSYGEGWIVKIKMDNKEELKDLISAKERLKK